MDQLEDLLQSIAVELGDPVGCAKLLKEKGYHASAGILAAGSPQELSTDCNLPIGSAKLIWRAAGKTTGGLTGHRSAPFVASVPFGCWQGVKGGLFMSRAYLEGIIM